MTQLQCGHGEFAVENPAASAAIAVLNGCFNAATANSPWRTLALGAESRQGFADRFNAATANSPWRTR